MLRHDAEILRQFMTLVSTSKDADALYRCALCVLANHKQALPFVLRLLDDEFRDAGEGLRPFCRAPPPHAVH